MTTRKVFGNAPYDGRLLRPHSVTVDTPGPGQLRRACGCCGQDAIMFGTFQSELGITMPHYWGRIPLCSPCRQGLTALAAGRKVIT